jgi:drug/metabolite transporter (DMT)-like permease
VERSPLAPGVLLALAAAVAFGASTPLLHRFGAGVGPVTTACLLYAGAAVVALLWPRKAGAEAKVRLGHAPRLLLVTVAGAVVAPTALAWGLQHADATSASLLLNFEAAFTVILASLVFGESIGLRVATAVALMVAGGVLLVLGAMHGPMPGAVTWGLVAVVVATLGWSVDNALTRPLADLDPMAVVAGKGTLGAALTALLALLLHEPLPGWRDALALVACGAAGYGLSLRLYLLAQRRIGAGRTASVFAVAPFIGAALAWALGDGQVNATTLVAGLLFGAAVWLHLTESHGHVHTHEPVEHEHAHRHDDGHHDHVHEPPVVGVHSHRHRHAVQTHEHPHAPDMHHAHRH